MDQKILRPHLMTGVYTYAGNYAAYFKSLPDDIPELCNCILNSPPVGDWDNCVE
jgi:hypothetical protein